MDKERCKEDVVLTLVFEVIFLFLVWQSFVYWMNGNLLKQVIFGVLSIPMGILTEYFWLRFWKVWKKEFKNKKLNKLKRGK